MRKVIPILLILCFAYMLMGIGPCDTSTAPTTQEKETAAASARQTRLIKLSSLPTDFNPLIERTNIIFRMMVTADGGIMYLYRYSETGQIM